MPLIVIIAVLGLAGLTIWLGIGPTFTASTLIEVRGGTVQVRRGDVHPLDKEKVADILRGAGVERGTIAISAAGRVRFSRTIPSHAHQRLRNVLLNR